MSSEDEEHLQRLFEQLAKQSQQIEGLQGDLEQVPPRIETLAKFFDDFLHMYAGSLPTIKALAERSKSQQREIAFLEKEASDLRDRLEKLERATGHDGSPRIGVR